MRHGILQIGQVLQSAMDLLQISTVAGTTYPRDMALCALCSPYFCDFIARCLIEMYPAE